MNDLVTIIINVFNGEKYILKCLDSVVKQSYKNLEILIIDDGSTDNTVNICTNLKDKRIKIISTEHLGLSQSRNIGIKNSNGKYLYFVDCDDFIDMDTIEYLLKLLNETGSDISFCSHLNIYNYNYKLSSKKENIEVLSNKDALKLILLKKKSNICIWNKLIKKNLINKFTFEDRIANDVAFTHKIFIKARRLVSSNLVKYYHLKNCDSVCRTKYDDYDRTIDLYKAAYQRYLYINDYFPYMIENRYAFFELSSQLYLRKNKKIIKYLNREPRKILKKVYTSSFFSLKISLKNKIKLFLYRYFPFFFRILGRKYMIMTEKSKMSRI